MKNLLKKTICMLCALATVALMGCGGNGETSSSEQQSNSEQASESSSASSSEEGGDEEDSVDAVEAFQGDVSAFSGGNYRAILETELTGYSMAAKKLIEDILNAESGGAYIYAEEIGNPSWKVEVNETMYCTKAEGEVSQVQLESAGAHQEESGTAYTYVNDEASYYHYWDENGEEVKGKESGASNTANSYLTRKLGFLGPMYLPRDGIFDMFIDEDDSDIQYVSGTKNTEYFIDDSDATCVKVKMVVTWTDYKTEVSNGSVNRLEQYYPESDTYAEIGSTITATDVLIALFDENGVCKGVLREVEGTYAATLLNQTQLEASFTDYAAFVPWSGEIIPPTDLDVYEEVP